MPCDVTYHYVDADDDDTVLEDVEAMEDKFNEFWNMVNQLHDL